MKRCMCIVEVSHGPPNSGLYRQVLLMKGCMCIVKVSHGPAYSGLCRQVVLVYRWFLCTVLTVSCRVLSLTVRP